MSNNEEDIYYEGMEEWKEFYEDMKKNDYIIPDCDPNFPPFFCTFPLEEAFATIAKHGVNTSIINLFLTILQRVLPVKIDDTMIKEWCRFWCRRYDVTLDKKALDVIEAFSQSAQAETSPRTAYRILLRTAKRLPEGEKLKALELLKKHRKEKGFSPWLRENSSPSLQIRDPEQMLDWLEDQNALRQKKGNAIWTPEISEETISTDYHCYNIDINTVLTSFSGDYASLANGDMKGQEIDDHDDVKQLDKTIKGWLGLPGSERGRKVEEFKEAIVEDRIAWYQPMHFYHEDWGIFILRDGLLRMVESMGLFLDAYPEDVHPNLSEQSSTFIRKQLIKASFVALYLHEMFHHYVEFFAVALHFAEKKARYVKYKRKVYNKMRGSDDWLEEALATASEFITIDQQHYRDILGPYSHVLQDYLRWHFPRKPAGYKQAIHFMTKSEYDYGVCMLSEQIQKASTGIQDDDEPDGYKRWLLVPGIGHYCCDVAGSGHLYEVVPKGEEPVLRGSCR